MIAKARQIIELIAKDPEPGTELEGEVVRTTSFGAFVEIAPGKDGMIHISKLSKKRVEKVEDVVNIGDKIMVKVDGISEKGIALSLIKKL